LTLQPIPKDFSFSWKGFHFCFGWKGFQANNFFFVILRYWISFKELDTDYVVILLCTQNSFCFIGDSFGMDKSSSWCWLCCFVSYCSLEFTWSY
jgi:hypothetical protein